MKTRNTLLLLVLAAGLFAFIYFYENKLPSTNEAAAESKRVVKLERDKINAITLTNNEEKVILHKENGKWWLTAPVRDRADESAVDALLTSVDSMQSDAAIESDEGANKVDIKDLGLTKSNLMLKLEGDSPAVELIFGKDAAVEGKVYLRRADSKTVYVVGNDLKNQVSKKADEFRDRRLTELNASQINKVQIKTGAGEIEFEKVRDHWEVNKPIRARGDDAKINDLIAQALNTRIDSFVAGELTTAAAGAIAEARGTVTLFAEGSTPPMVLQISKTSEKDKEKVYAKLSSRDAILLLPKSVGDILNITPNDVRDKHLVRLNLDIVDRIHITAAGSPGIVLARHQEDWLLKSSGDKPANALEVRKMADALQNQNVTAFVSDVATDLPKYGLDRPACQVNFASFASENTAESKAGENSIVTVQFGKVDGDNVYAKLDTEPFIVSVPKSILDAVPTDPVLWQDLAIFKAKPEDVTTLEVTPNNQQTLVLTKENGKWKPAKGDAIVNNTAVQSLLNTLTTLHAVRWAGAAKPEHGLVKPALILKFTTADKKTGTLRIGAPTPEGMWFAAADGMEGTLVVNKPDYEAFGATLLQSAPATPAMSASPTAATTPEAVTAEPIPIPSSSPLVSP